MLSKIFRRLPLPKSLRRQFVVALACLELLMVAGGLITVHALRQSADATRQLAEARLLRLQDAQELVQRTLIIEHHSEQMLTSSSLDEVHAVDDEITGELELLDRLVDQLATSSSDVAVLGLHESSQLFRNTAHIVAGLREEELRSLAPGTPPTLVPPVKSEDPNMADRQKKLRHFHSELHHQAVGMARAAQEVSDKITAEYRGAVRQVADFSSRNQEWVLALFLGSLVLTWVVYEYFLRRKVLDRLQQVSNYLRQSEVQENQRPKVPVNGSDEIGEMARAVEQFLEDRRRLAEANSELEAFSYSVSHDLQAPLRAIDGYSQILLRTPPDQLQEEGPGYLESIHRNALRMRDLIQDILKFSRMSRQSMVMGSVDIGSLVEDVFEELREQAPQRKISLRLGKLSPAQGDTPLIRQVLVNLLSNAVKFTGGQPEAIIEVTCVEEGNANTYCVKDNGVGFDMEHADELFGVFHRLHSSREFEGTGLGLAIVKRIILRHGGRVWAQSEPGQGASMFFTLPKVL